MSCIFVGLVGYWIATCFVNFAITVVEVAEATPRPGDARPIHDGFEPSFDGPRIAIRFRADVDLEELAPRRTHHLYFALVAPGQDEFTPQLWTGGVFRVSGSSPPLYEVHVPAAVERLIDHLGRDAYRDVIESARSGKLRLVVGGGKMVGARMFAVSDVPLVLEGNRVVVRW